MGRVDGKSAGSELAAREGAVADSGGATDATLVDWVEQAESASEKQTTAANLKLDRVGTS
jgi:hypothetical protein